MKAKEVKELEKKYIGQTYKRYDVVFKDGSGSILTDTEGKKYVDFFSGIAVNALGYGNKGINAAIKKQADRYIHFSNHFYIDTQSSLAKLIVENSFGSRVFYVNTGSEANEVAMKIARKWGILHKDRANGIISFYNSFHGRTAAALTATAQEKFHKYLNPVMPGHVYAKFNDIEDVRSKIDSQTAAVMVEPVQAEGGILMPEPGFLKALRKLCDEKNVLLIFDEVQTGMGRLGRLFGYEVYGVKPDIMTIAKSIGGGIPLAAVIINKELEHVFTYGDHGTTMGGNPLACAAGEVVFKTVMKPAFLKDVRKKGGYIISTVKKWNNPRILEVRGAGLLIGLQLKEGVSEVVVRALKEGLIINGTGHETVRIEPPLNIPMPALKKGLDILKKVI
jgi:acetylornithine/N-succinyldiaminopimelate aminotransferase